MTATLGLSYSEFIEYGRLHYYLKLVLTFGLKLSLISLLCSYAYDHNPLTYMALTIFTFVITFFPGQFCHVAMCFSGRKQRKLSLNFSLQKKRKN